MSKKLIRGFRTNIMLYGLCLTAFVVATIPFSPLLAVAEALVSALVLYVGVRRNRMAQHSVRQYLDRVSGGIDTARSSNMLYAPLPMLVFDLNTGEVLWGNDRFLALTELKEKMFESLVNNVVPGFDGSRGSVYLEYDIFFDANNIPTKIQNYSKVGTQRQNFLPSEGY